MTSPRYLTLCADDYAYSHAVNNGILHLAQLGRIQAISCMSNSPLWPESGVVLRQLNYCDIGLHLNLTNGNPLSARLGNKVTQLNPLSTLLSQLMLHRIGFEDIKAEITAQLTAFETVLGRRPDFIDGHQHVQQMKVIRDALLAIYLERFGHLSAPQRPYLRLSHMPSVKSVPGGLKRWVVNHLGAQPFKRQLEKHGIVHNVELLGSYAFERTSNYSSIIETYLKMAKNHTILMCHPAARPNPDNNTEDPILTARLNEFDYLCQDMVTQRAHELRIEFRPLSRDRH